MPDSQTFPRLTSLAHGGGCGCKLAPNVLADLLSEMPLSLGHANLIVDAGTSDDAAVYRVNDTTALVATTDFFTPIVDKFELFGEPGTMVHDYEKSCFAKVNIDRDGARACNMCEIWAIQNINDQFKAGAFPPPMHVAIAKEVFQIGDSLKTIFAASFQV